jgi:integrase
LSVYKHRDGRSPFWHFDFQVRGNRFHGSTKCTTRRKAEKIVAAEREKAKRLVAQLAAAKTSLRLDDVADRYWNEVGQHHAGADNTEHDLALLIEFFGKDKLLPDITSDGVARLVAWRRGHRGQAGTVPASKRGIVTIVPTPRLISPHTVNHTTTTLRKLFTRAKLWGVRFEHEPRWSRHLLPTPAERVRELSDDESDRLDAVMRDDFRPFFDFARASGLRLAECLLHWSEVDMSARQIRKRGKGGQLVTTPITPTIREIIWPLREHHPEFVFTFVADRTTAGGRAKGKRYPLTYVGVQSYWKRLRRQSGLTDFRFHDLRHDFGTKLLRATGNLKLVQRALNHKDIKTTTRYAHVLDSEVAEAMERVAESRSKSRSRLREVG